MGDRGTLDSAILDAEGSIALLYMVEDALLNSTWAGPNRLGIEPPEGRYVFVLDHAEYCALARVINIVGDDVKAISAAFHAYKPGAL